MKAMLKKTSRQPDCEGLGITGVASTGPSSSPGRISCNISRDISGTVNVQESLPEAVTA